MSATHEVRTPIPGIFYRRPAPGQDPFVEVGRTIAAGDTVGMVEIMKSFHPVISEVAGEVISLAEDLAEVGPGDEVAQVRAQATA